MTLQERHEDVAGRSRVALRVLVIRYIVTGLQLHVESNVRPLMALAKRGHLVRYIAAQTRESAGTVIDVPNFEMNTVLLPRVVRALSPIMFQLVVLYRFLRSLRMWDVIILDGYSVVTLFPILLLMRLGKGAPAMFLRVHSNPVETGGHVQSLVLTFLDALSMKLAAVVVHMILFISPMMGHSYSDRLHIPMSKVRVMPSSVDTSVFNPLSVSNVDILREELGLSDQLAILYHGDVTRGRGVMDLVEAFKILRDESVEAVLILLGYGSFLEEVRKYVQTNRLEDIVRVHGRVDYEEVPGYVAACDAGIVPLPDHSWWRDQCPIKLIECLAMNKSVVVSNIPANRWIVGDAPVAVYLTGTSAREIADGIRAFSRVRNSLDPTLGARLASNFSVEKIAEDIEHEILSVIRRRDRACAGVSRRG